MRPPLRAAVGAGGELVGRSEVVASITDSWDVSASRPVVLLGEPGIGKTCVAEAVCSTVGSDTIWVSFEPSVSNGFSRLCAAIDAGHVGGTSARWPPSAGTASSRRRPPAVAGRSPPARTRRARRGRPDQLLRCGSRCRRCAGASPVLVLDDLQRAGGTTIALLQRVLTATTPLRVLATCRPPLPAGMDTVESHVVRIGGLGSDDLERMLRTQGFTDEVAAPAAREGAGNPLLAIAAAGAGAGARPAGVDPIASRFLHLAPDDAVVIGVAALVAVVWTCRS